MLYENAYTCTPSVETTFFSHATKAALSLKKKLLANEIGPQGETQVRHVFLYTERPSGRQSVPPD